MINIDRENCIGCGICINVCPQQAISLEDNAAVINEKKCSQCSQCVSVCPVKAIDEGSPVRTETNIAVGTMIAQYGFGRGYRGRGKGRYRTLYSLHPQQFRRK